MSIEAMNEAWYLEKQKNPHTAFNSWCRGYEAGVKAIEQEEKQQALDKKADNARELGLDYEPEPMAWMTNSEHEYSIEYKFNWLQTPLHDIPLYTAPLRKEWVGLTDEEIDELHGSPMALEHSAELKWVRTIEAKLKEKNT